MYSEPIAYLLWFFSGFGALGLHRFYLGKKATGLLYLCTGGLGLVGGIYDLFNMSRIVRDANLKFKYQRAFLMDNDIKMPVPKKKKDSVERVILKTAKKNKGIITPGEVALEGDFSIEEAKKYLEKLTSKGFTEMRIKKSGVIVYCFPEFMDTKNMEFEDI